MKYEIKGKPLPVAILHLDQGESILTDSGAMVWMKPALTMDTVSGGMKSLFGRAFSGETLFLNKYTAKEPSMIALGSSFPGDILVYDVSKGDIIFQKSSYLASEETVKREISFSKKGTIGFFGGEGFIMNRYYGSGLLFIEIDGTAIEYDLNPSEEMVINTGNLVAMSSSCHIDVVSVKGMKNKLLGGEGFFNTVVTGPGHVIVQTMPISTLAESLSGYMPTND